MNIPNFSTIKNALNPFLSANKLNSLFYLAVVVEYKVLLGQMAVDHDATNVPSNVE